MNNSAIYSIKAVCKLLRLSRSQFWNLQKQGIFPVCLKDQTTGRHYFNEELKDVCVEVRKTGIGINGYHHLFYDPRKPSCKPRKVKSQNNGEMSAYLEILKSMGLDGITAKEIELAIISMYQDDVPTEEGIMIRDLYRYFRNSEK